MSLKEERQRMPNPEDGYSRYYLVGDKSETEYQEFKMGGHQNLEISAAQMMPCWSWGCNDYIQVNWVYFTEN